MIPDLISTEITHENPYYRIRHDTLQYPDRIGHYYVAESQPAALTIAFRDEQVLMVTQYRHTMGKDSIEFPCGSCKAGETLAQAAQRELQEEGGIVAGRVTELGSFYSLNGFCNNKVHVFQAEGLTDVARHLDEEEAGLKTHWVPLSDLARLIKAGTIQDGESLAAWTIFEHSQRSN